MVNLGMKDQEHDESPNTPTESLDSEIIREKLVDEKKKQTRL